MKLIRWILGKIILSLDAIFAPQSVVRTAEAQAKIRASLDGLSLYQFHACPFCVKVRRFMKAEMLDIPLRDATRDPFRKELVEQGGRLQVPCLRIETEGSVRWLYESDDIIAFLRTKVAD